MLEHLLQSIFDRDALKKFLGAFADGEEMRYYLPGDSASWQSTATSAAEELLRRGYGGHAAFWEALVSARPHQRDHIIDVMRHYLPSCELSAPKPLFRPGIGRPASLRGLLAGLVVGLMGVSSLALAAVSVLESDSSQRARESWVFPTPRIPQSLTPAATITDGETMILHLREVASILEREAIVEDQPGARDAARRTSAMAIIWREKAVLDSKGE